MQSDIVQEARLDAKAFRENAVYTSDGQRVKLGANADRLDAYASHMDAQAAEITRLTEALRAAEERAGLLQDGWVLVPEEPTPAMLETARDGVILGPKMDELMKRGLRANWKAMIRAALKGPSHDA